MPKTIIDSESAQEIRHALAGLSGARAKSEITRWANLLGCHPDRIYRVTKDLRPPRKPRADKGKRRADLLTHEGLRFVAEACALKNVAPEDAIETARLNGFEVPVSDGTLRRYLREHGVNREQIRNPKKPYRSWSAQTPLELFQFDITGFKERWLDLRTRRILHVSSLEVSKNHPNENRNRVKVWAFHLLDDCARYHYVRYVAVDKPNTCHVIEFLWSAFRELGVPLWVYTDNDPIIVNRRMRRATEILNRLLADSGGFRIEQHLPGNAAATGKVEASHKFMERFNNLIGLKINVPSSIEELNDFAAAVCEKMNWRESRATVIAPMLRFREGHQAARMPPPEILDSAFKADVFDRTVAGNLTFSVENVHYQLPRSAQIKGKPNPFLNVAGRRGAKINIVWPPGEDYFVAICDGMQYEFDRVVAQADAAGEFKTAAESVGQQTMKSLKTSHAARRRAHIAAGTDIIVQGLDAPFAPSASQASDQTAIFPRKKIETNPELIAALAPGSIPPSMVSGQLIDRWAAASLLAEEGHFNVSEAGQIHAADMAWLKAVYDGRDKMLDTELREHLAQRDVAGSDRRVVAMKSA